MRRLFIMRKDLHMSTGKLIAQTCHCAEAYWTKMLQNASRIEVDGCDTYVLMVSIQNEVLEEYIRGTFTKIVCEAKSKAHLLKAKVAADEIGLVESVDYGLIYDNCLTELEPEEQDGTTLTGMWFRPLPDEQAIMLSRKYQLYK